MSLRRRLRVLRDDSGMTLIELMVAGLMFTILMLAALAALDTATKAERGQDARNQAMLEIRGAMDRFTKELRQATSIDPTSNHTMLKMKTLISGVETQVTYQLVDVGGGLYDLRRTVGAGSAVDPGQEHGHRDDAVRNAGPAVLLLVLLRGRSVRVHRRDERGSGAGCRTR